jgi:hypothetical protein
MGKCVTRYGSKWDPDDCVGMEYGRMDGSAEFLKEFPGTESFVPTFPLQHG